MLTSSNSAAQLRRGLPSVSSSHSLRGSARIGGSNAMDARARPKFTRKNTFKHRVDSFRRLGRQDSYHLMLARDGEGNVRPTNDASPGSVGGSFRNLNSLKGAAGLPRTSSNRAGGFVTAAGGDDFDDGLCILSSDGAAYANPPRKSQSKTGGKVLPAHRVSRIGNAGPKGVGLTGTFNAGAGHARPGVGPSPRNQIRKATTIGDPSSLRGLRY